MEDQGKRLLIVVALSAVVLFGMQYFWGSGPKKPAPPPPAAETSATTPAVAGPVQPPAPPTEAQKALAQVPVCDEAEDAADPIFWNAEHFEATFSRCGGTVKSLRLLGSQYREKGAPMDLAQNLVKPEWYPFRTQVAVATPGAKPTEADLVGLIPADAKWEPIVRTPSKVVFLWPPKGAPRARGIEVEKSFERTKGDYVVELVTTVRNVSGADVQAVLSTKLHRWQDPQAKSGGMFSYAPPHWGMVCNVNGGSKGLALGTLRRGPREYTGDIRWTGAWHKYFVFVMAPADDKPEVERDNSCNGFLADKSGVMGAEVIYAPATIAKGGEASRRALVYAGPKILSQLEAFASIPGGKHAGLGQAVDLGWFSFIARPMLWLLKKFHAIVGNWGVAIILLTLTVKLLTLYWTQKSMKSMKGMSKLKPKIDELRAKYPDDKQRVNVEMMALYKEHKINPLGGCLPMLLQMPVWFALYATLGAAAELYQAPFVLWIDDLTAPDRYFVIPILLMVLMFVQAKISPAAVDSSQQKMMMYVMPIMFGGFSLFFPSGLTIYILTNTLLSFAHQYWMNKQDDNTPAPAPAPPARTKPSGGGGGGGKKKPAKA